MNAETYVERFRVYMRRMGMSENTQRTYGSALAKGLWRFKNYNQPKDVPAWEWEGYFASIRGTAWRRIVISCFKTFYEEIVGQPDKLAKVALPRKDNKLPVVLSRQQIEDMINGTDNLKHKLLICLQYACGLRVSELTAIEFGHINRDRQRLMVKQSKNRKDREVPLPASILDLMTGYYKACKIKPKKYLFEGDGGQRYSVRSIQKVFAGALERAGIHAQAGTHSLRHSFATHTLELGVDCRFIKDLLGHNNIKTTLRYTHVAAHQMNSLPNPFNELRI